MKKHFKDADSSKVKEVSPNAPSAGPDPQETDFCQDRYRVGESHWEIMVVQELDKN
jgi:hypothetical protein